MVIIFKVATEICLNVEVLVGLGFFRFVVFRMMLLLTGGKNHMVFWKREKAMECLRIASGSRYMLSAGCEVPAAVDDAVFRAFC